ncbi:MAG: NTP/NDP exchange transporter [Rhabdochlamydiaceae bacterium]|nr:NTP/NDP exchange transporter [Rhabdochlamydiaceae bacterium]
MSASSQTDFSRLRSFLWPIHRHELKKFVPLLLIFFLVGFNYSLLRATKDALVVTAPSSGAEALPFLKVWAILPMALLFTFIFTRVSNRVTREKVFYIMMSIFIGFFLLFMFFLYPYQDALHPHALCDRIQQMLPVGCQGLIAMFRNWTFTLFYVMSEMWSTIIMTVLSWGFANDVTSVKDARRFYGLLGISINFSGIAAGQVATSMSQYTFNPNLPFGVDGWGQSIFFLNAIIVLASFVCMGLFRYIHAHGFGYNSASYFEQNGTSEVKMGLRKNFSYLAKSKYLISIAIIVVMYNIAINLIEVVWKDQVKQLYPNPADFNAYMGKILTSIGIVATVTSIFISGTVIRRFSWKSSAMISPLILLVTGIAFFFFFFFKDSSFAGIAAAFGTTPLVLCCFFGSLQNCLARASKYTLFDATKELAFIPLSKECKLKGKAAIDGVGSRLGKSGGSIIHQGLLMLFGTVALSTPYVAGLLLIVICAWMFAVNSLGKRFNALVAHKETLDVPDDDKPPLKPNLSEPLTQQ